MDDMLRYKLSEIETIAPCGVRPPAKKGRPRIEHRTRTIEARKPWLKLEMSRRTCRQAEQRKAGSDPGFCSFFVPGVSPMLSAYDSIDVPEAMATLINNLANLTHREQSFAVSLLDQLSYRDLSDERLWKLDALANKSLCNSTPKWIKPLKTVK
jgi:hypothetical protein